ncbi:rRNA maturation RNase YbeY [Flavicella sp.]|uniref:rRNA maturation RNase YbeY n=1 Tax=Flavicella sp. TaxID=2957742 RepID=UPI003016BBAF
MIEFNYELDFKIDDEKSFRNWISSVVEDHDCTLGELNFIFCDDAYLLKLNVEFLEHDTLTDIISFDYTIGKLIGGDVFISVERVRDNAANLDHSFLDELKRVMIHGVLHYIGFNDKNYKDKVEMRFQENASFLLFK